MTGFCENGNEYLASTKEVNSLINKHELSKEDPIPRC